MIMEFVSIWALLTRKHVNQFSLPKFIHSSRVLHPWVKYAYRSMQFLFLYNIFSACFPLLRRKDDLSDIALTPAQRKLLGLAPSSKPPTPGTQYITPPRYARTPTSLNGSPASNGPYSNSPSGSPGQGIRSASPFSPGASPLLHKAVGGYDGSRRHSYGSGSPFGLSSSRVSISEAPGTPSPSAPKASVGLNNRWLYEKGRRSSGQPRLYA